MSLIEDQSPNILLKHQNLELGLENQACGYPRCPPRQAMAAGAAVWEAVRFLSGMDCPPSLRGVISINALDWVGYKL
jgi:hypothetical protein